MDKVFIKKPLSRIRKQPLRIYPDWEIVINDFSELDPQVIHPEDQETWSWMFLQDLLYLRYVHDDIGLDVGWYPEGDPNGSYDLEVIKRGDWVNPYKSFSTKSTETVVSLIEKITYNIHHTRNPVELDVKSEVPFFLQPLIIYPSWTVLHNQFMELDPQTIHPHEKNKWAFFTDNLLKLGWRNGEKLVHLGWYPSESPRGFYEVKLIDHCNWNYPSVCRRTRKKGEVIKLISNITSGFLSS